MAASGATIQKLLQSRLVNDGLTNLVSGMNTSKDKLAYNSYELDEFSVDFNQMSNMYRTDWMAAKIIDIVPDEMTREWRKFTANEDPVIIDKLVKAEGALKVRKKFYEAMKWARLFGGAAIILGLDDGLSPEQPLDIDKVKQGSLKFLHVVDRRSCFPLMFGLNTFNPGSEFFLQPEFYAITNYHNAVNGSSSSIILPGGMRENVSAYQFKIHRSRLIFFQGVELPNLEAYRNSYWGDSVLLKIKQAIHNAASSQNSGASLVMESNVNVIYIHDFLTKIQNERGSAAVLEYLQMANVFKSNNNSIVLDMEDQKLERHELNFSGLGDLIDKFLGIIAAAADIPATRLLGASPGGLNATGESDIINFYDSLKSKQNTELAPKLNDFDKILCKSTLGYVLDDLNYNFVPLWQLPESQKIDNKLKNAQADQIYIDSRVINEAIAAKELQQNEVYTNITDEHIEDLEQMELEQEMDFESENNEPTAQKEAVNN